MVAKRFSAQLIYNMLNNRTYLGKITHARGGTVDVHQGLHDPIIDQDTWDRAQAVSTTIKRSTPVVWTHTHLLHGKIRSFEGYAMSPASVPKKKVHPDGTGTIRRVRYYCSQKGIRQGYKNCPIKTINAHRA
jgi:site-specific DNA recombinase